jgi:L-rhamnose isomerase/sugar isomerase
VRAQAVAHNIECIELGKALGSKAHTVWIGDGGNFPGQQHFRGALERLSRKYARDLCGAADDWRIFIEHKFYEPAFYSTVINDWGTSYHCARELGPKAFCLVDLGHHAPNVNIEMIVARLIQFGKLAGFHFNDSKYGDDDLDAGSIKPFQLFLIFNELVDAELNELEKFQPAYMLDQSHNVTDPIESLMMSAVELVRAYVQAHLVDRAALSDAQEKCDPLSALSILKQAFATDVDAHFGRGARARRRRHRPDWHLSREWLSPNEIRGTSGAKGSYRLGDCLGGQWSVVSGQWREMACCYGSATPMRGKSLTCR